MEPTPLVQSGIAAYKVGNKEEAIRILSQAVRENRDDETAWLYLGAAIDDPDRKRQAFEHVLQINPDNEKAKNALARLDASSGEPVGASAGPAGTGGTAPRAGTSASDSTSGGTGINAMAFKLPFEVEGSPEILTVPYIVENVQRRINQALQLYMTRDFEILVNEAQGASLWDSIFIAGVGVVAVGASQLIGRLIGWPLGGFVLGIGGLISPFVAAVVSMIATAVGFATAVYASRFYLQNENVNVSLPQHSMYYALVFLPLTLVNAALSFFAYAIGGFILCLFPLVALVGIGLLVYNWFLLKGAFDRVYGAEKNRGTITAAVAVIGGAVGAGIVQLILGGIFRLRY